MYTAEAPGAFLTCLIADVRILALARNHHFAQILTQIWIRKSPFTSSGKLFD